MLELPGVSREIDPQARSPPSSPSTRPGAADDLRRGAQAAAGALADLARRASWPSAATRGPAPCRPAQSQDGPQAELADGAARDAARLGARPPRRRRAGRRAALRRRRLRGAGGPGGGEEGQPREDLLDRLRGARFDELARARLVAERYGTDHHELVLRPDAVELLPKLVEAFDEPFGDSSAIPTYLVSELAAGDVKVALSGEGGDELFGGYYTYVADLLAPRVGRLRRRSPRR